MTKSNTKAFTLIELLIVIVIIGILAVALIPRLTGAQATARDTARKATLQQAATVIVSYNSQGSTPLAVDGTALTGTQATTVAANGNLALVDPQGKPLYAQNGSVSSVILCVNMEKAGAGNATAGTATCADAMTSSGAAELAVAGPAGPDSKVYLLKASY